MSSMDSQSKTYQRKSDETGKGDKSREDIVEKELKSLFRSGKSTLTFSDLLQLRNKYSDEKLIDDIYEAYHKQQEQIRKQAKKFTEFLIKKYASQRYPFHKILQKAMKIKKKHNLSDAAFEEFTRQYQLRLSGDQGELTFPRTNIGKALGAMPFEITEGLNVSENEYGVLQDILKLYESSKVLYSQIMLQTLTYRDCAPESLKGQFDQSKNNPTSFVHPIIAALFFPKICLLEEHMLYANIAYIIKSRHEKKAIKTRPNYELYCDLVLDPQDVVCNVESPLADLRNRVQLQIQLWESVLSLRNGQYYKDNLTNFLAAVDNCRLSIYDMPDLMYVKDEGAILRRLLAAFSLRPTVVTTTPIYGIVSNNPWDRTLVMPRVRQVPMISLKLPVSVLQTDAVIRLESALEQYNWFIENKTLVPKIQSIVYSRDVLFFYVNRRFQNVNISRYTEPYNFVNLPLTISGIEQINERAVDFEPTMTVNQDTYELRSVVLVEKTRVGGANVIIGATTALMKHRDYNAGQVEDTFLLYDPLGAGQLFQNPANPNNYVKNAPITFIPGDVPFNATTNRPETFFERASKRGTIFVYQKRRTVVTL